MQCSGPSSTLRRLTRNLYLTAIAEVDDVQLLELVAGADLALEQHSKDITAGKDRVAKRKAWLDAAQMARTLYSAYEKRMRDRTSLPGVTPFARAGSRESWENPKSCSRGKILLFRAQSTSPVTGCPARRPTAYLS